MYSPPKAARRLAFVAAASLAACASQTYDVDAGVMFARVTGDVALQNAAGSLALGDNQNDIDRDFGLGDTEVSPYLRVQTDYGPHRFRADGFAVDAEGSGTLAGDFGDLSGGSVVSTSMEVWGVGGTYLYELLRGENWRLGGGLSLDFFSLELSARSTGGRESLDTTLLVPMPCVEGEVFLGSFTLGANAAAMSADLGDGNGRYLDAEGYVKVRPLDSLELMVGYRYLVFDAYGSASGRDFDADIDLHGIIIGGGVSF